MKINIQIEDASPEELQRLFAGPQGIAFKSAKVKIAEVFKKLQSVEVKKKEHKSGNKYGLPPHLFSQNKKLYQRLWGRCKAKGIMYDEALKLEAPTKVKDLPKFLIESPEEKPKEKQSKPDPSRPTPPAQEKLRKAIVAKNGAIHAGQFVKHNGSGSSPFFGQIGQVIKVNDRGEIFVKFGSSTTWLAQYLVMVMPDQAAAATATSEGGA
jgi:hypothetical protein